jgi:O-antigen/teichoic acid export membrane protein
LAHSKGSGGLERVRRVVGDATRYFLFLGIFLAGVGVLWSAPAIFVMYGKQYESVVKVLQLMVLISGLLLVENPFSSLLLIIDDQRIRTGLSISYFALSAVTAFALVPTFGMIGAVAANGISRSVISGITMVWVSRRVEFTPPWRDLSKIAMAGVWAALAAAVLIEISSHFAVQVLAGFVFIAVLMWLSVRLNVWKAHDVRLLIMIAERKPKLFARWLPKLELWAQRVGRLDEPPSDPG